MKKPRKQKKALRTLIAVLAVPVLLLVLFSAWKVCTIVSGYRSAERRYDSLAQSVAVPAAPSAAPQSTPIPAAAETPPIEETAQTDEPQPLQTPRELSPVAVDFDELRRLSSDVVGWLCLPDTAINYPVMQGRDNKYYLERFLDGSTAAGGSLFVDYLCPSDFSGKNTIIYGHNMRDGSMFALIDDFADQAFFEAHPVFYLNTPARNYRVDIFSGFTADPEGFVYTSAFASDEDYAAFLRTVAAASEIDCGVEVSAEERIVTLSTCTYSGEDVRFVLCGKLTEIG